MPTDHRAPNINARRLGLYLRVTREKVLEVSYDEAAVLLGCAPEWLVRVETGFAAPSPDEVERMLSRYGMRDAKVADVMIDLASRPEGPPWLPAHLDRLSPSDRDVLISESEASVIRSYQLLLVPDLVRVEPYARLLLSHLKPDRDVDAEWDLLRSRQQYRPGGRERVLHVILDEGVLTRITAAVNQRAEMTAQLHHLVDRSLEPATTIRVVPKGARWYEDRLNPFHILEFPGIADRITLAPHALGTDFSRSDATDAWTAIEDQALPAGESRALMRQRLTELRSPDR